MFKKLTAMALAIGIIGGISQAFAWEGPEIREEITDPPAVVSQKQFDYISANSTYTLLDISPYTTRAYKDEVEGDGKGGWSDQGENDMRSFTLRGRNVLLGIPFTFIEPNDNNGTSVIAMRGQNALTLPTLIEIPINQQFGGLYFVHAASWGDGQECGRYSLIYDDGTCAFVRIVEQRNIRDFWQTQENEYMKQVWKGQNPQSKLSVNMFAFDNPHPEKTVKRLLIESKGTNDYIMIMAITLCSNKAYLVGNSIDQSPSTQNWINYGEKTNECVSKGSALDASDLLDAPAGKHGRLKTSGDSLVFNDGTEFKLWGTNIKGSAAFMEKEKASFTAKKIAMAGYNAVRFTGLDHNGTHYLSDRELDRFAYFINELRNNGVYSYISLQIKLSDNFPAQFFNERIIDEQKTFADRLTGYISPYTNEPIAKDKSIIMMEAADGNSMFLYQPGYGKYALTNKDYKEELDKLWHEYLKKYTDGGLRSRWGSGYSGLPAGMSIKEENIPLEPAWKGALFSKEKKKTIAEFFASLEEKYSEKILSIPRSYGYTGLTNVSSGATNKTDRMTVLAQKKYDFISSCYSWQDIDNPDKLTEGKYVGTFKAMYADKFLGIIGAAAENRVGKRPYVIAEYASPQPNIFYIQSNFAMAAYAARNGWYPFADCFADGEFEYGYYIEDRFSAATDPLRLETAPALSYIYNYMPKMTKTAVYIPEIDILGGYNKTISNKVLLGQNTVFQSAGAKDDLPENIRHLSNVSAGGVFFNGEKHYLKIDLDRIQAVSGELSDVQVLKYISVNSYNMSSNIILVPIDDKTIKESERLLLTASGMCKNKNMSIHDATIESMGEKCAMLEPINANITVRTGNEYDIYILDEKGNRVDTLPYTKDSSGAISFDLNMGKVYNAVNFELIRK